MTEKPIRQVPDQEPNVIFLGDEAFYLTRPKGRAGRRFISAVQEALRSVTPAMGTGDGAAGTDIDTLIKVSNRLFEDESLRFEELILPGMLRHTTAGLKDAQIEKLLEDLPDPPMRIMFEFIHAANFWLGMSGYNREELLASLKKSKGGGAGEE